MSESTTKTHYTAKELAGLPGLPQTVKGVIARAKAEAWASRKRDGRGGGREYPLAALPPETRRHLLDAALDLAAERVETLPAATASLPATAVETLPATVPAALPDLASLKTWQTRQMDARLEIMRLLEQAEMTFGVTRAVETLAAKSRAGALPPAVQALVPIANARAGKGGAASLSRRTLMRWWGAYKKAGGNYAALAPAPVEKDAMPVWAADFLAQYRVPQKISVADAIERMRLVLPAGAALPTEGQARRFLKKFSRLDAQRGRKSGSELRGQRLWRARDVSEFQPLDIVQIDGHSFKAYVAHPTHGRPFKPEVCAVIDTVTKAVIGWSAGLAESAQTVADALRHAVATSDDKPLGGLPLFVYADRGAGNMAKVNIDEVAGLLPRLGVRFECGRPGNPQGRGLVENLNKSLWIPAAKKLDTYTGTDMDSLAKRQVYLTLQKEVRAARAEQREVKSALLIPWSAFLEFAQEAVDAYNARPHSALPRITDPATGLRRHLSPLEAWQAWRARGWDPDTLTPAEIDHLFRPHVAAKCNRGTVRLWNNVYADPALEHYHGMELLVGYDIHDPRRVWVRDANGRLIVIARLDAHKSAFLPVSKVEKAREDRYKNRKRTADRRQEEIELERRGTVEIESAPRVIELTAAEMEASERIIARVANKKRLVSNAWERYEEILALEASGAASAYELEWKRDYEVYTETGKRGGVLKDDEFCVKGRADATGR